MLYVPTVPSRPQAPEGLAVPVHGVGTRGLRQGGDRRVLLLLSGHVCVSLSIEFTEPFMDAACDYMNKTKEELLEEYCCPASGGAASGHSRQ
jgi:hypothetical protein